MRTNIVINDELMTRAMELNKGKTKKAIVEEALQLMIRIKEQLKIRNLKGKLNWEGDIDQLRTDS